jgi:ADP-heptose:LPS heptosyltransferase
LDEKLGTSFAGFALVVSYLYDPDGVFQSNVARCSQAQFIAGPHRPDDHRNLHAADVFLRPLERLAIFDADPVPRLELVSPTDIPLPPGRWLALHPGSGSERKNWPEENWRHLVSGLVQTTEFGLLLVGGEAERDRLHRLSGAVPQPRCHLAQGLPLVELAQLIKQCVGFVGHDSGISHLAAALGLRGLLLWSDTNEAVWRPRSERMTLLRHPGGITNITVDSVAAGLSALV